MRACVVRINRSLLKTVRQTPKSSTPVSFSFEGALDINVAQKSRGRLGVGLGTWVSGVRFSAA